MHVAITNAVVSNTGDAAIVEGIVQSLVIAGVCTDDEVVVLDSNAAETAALYPGWRVEQQMTVSTVAGSGMLARIARKLSKGAVRVIVRAPAVGRALLAPGRPLGGLRLARGFAVLDAADVVISTGGTYLVDHYDFSNKVTELELARSLGKPVFLWTQSMGPFASEKARTSIRRLSGVATGVFYRDEKSRTHWASVLEPAPTSEVVPDVAFVLRPCPVPPEGAGRRALISVREWTHGGAGGGGFSPEAYERSLRSLAEGLVLRGWEVIAVSTCQGLDSYPVDDSRLAARLFDGLEVTIDSAHHTPAQLQALIASASLVVTTRMHQAILALLQGVDTVAIAYEFKTSELFESVGLGTQVTAIEAVDEDWVTDTLTALDTGTIVPLDPSRTALLRAGANRPAELMAAVDRVRASS